MSLFARRLSANMPTSYPHKGGILPYTKADAFVIGGKMHASETNAIVAAVAEKLGKNVAFARAAVENAESLIPLLVRAEELRKER